MKNNSLVWFKNDLRTIDNQSLEKATSQSKKIIACYCIEPNLFENNNFGFKKMEKFRAKFLLETLEDLKSQLATFNIPLFVFLEAPENCISDLKVKHQINTIYMQEEWTDEEVKAVQNVKNKLVQNGDVVEWNFSYDQFLFAPEDIPFEIDNTPQVFTAFRKKIEKYSTVNMVQAINRNFRQETIENPTSIPSLSDLGFEDFELPVQSAFPFKGGENAAWNRLEQYFWDTKKVSYYKQTRNGLVGTDYSSKFSAWLANGSISARSIYWGIKKYEKEVVKNSSTYWLIFELIWRDYFKYISLKQANNIFKIGGILEKSYEWKNNPNLIQKWTEGNTGKSFVDANMIELRETGWMSNRGRQNVASYFAKELLLDWRIGAAYFEAMLVDYDVHSNYGNWMYVAGVGNDPRDRKFNVDLQAQRYDPNGKFQKLWLQPTLF